MTIHFCRLVIGLTVSIVGGDIVVWGLVEKWLAPFAAKKHGEDYLKRKSHLSRLVGIVERGICIGALLLGKSQGWQVIAAWLALKVAARWQKVSDRPALKDSDNIWLIGTAVSVVFGILGAWITVGQLPIPLKP
jgi:hypothetical protein